MRRLTKGLKCFTVLALSAVMIATEMPLTVFAVAREETTEAVMEPETEIETGILSAEPETETETLTEKTEETEAESQPESEADSPQEQETEEVYTKEQFNAETTENESMTSEENPAETESISMEEASDEEQIQSDEATEDIPESSDSDFIIQDGVLTGYTGTSANVVIPEGVITIGANAFRNNTAIKAVEFPATVETIQSQAFQGCSSLTTVDLNEGLKEIEEYAFDGVAFGGLSDTGRIELGTLTVPGTVQHIGLCAFSGSTYLGEIIFANGENKILQFSQIFSTFGSENLMRVTLPDRLKTVPEEAFRYCRNLQEVTFGNRLEEIGDYAFQDCSSLKGIELPSTTKKIGEFAFSECSHLAFAKLNEGLETIETGAFDKAAFGELLDTGKEELGVLTIPGTVQYIGAGVFSESAYLGEIIFENGENELLEVAEFSDFARGCGNLTKVTLPDRLKIIPAGTFKNCTNLQEITFGSMLEEIGESAFGNCSSLKSIELPLSVKKIGIGAFENCSSLETAALNEGLKIIDKGAFYKVAFGAEAEGAQTKTLGVLTIPSTVQVIESGAFQDCAYLGEIIFANGENELLQINSNPRVEAYAAFAQCENLKKVTFPDRLKTIPESAFMNCTELEEIIFGNNLEEIEKLAFSGCVSLKSICLPETVKTIGAEAFGSCVSLNHIELNEGLKKIGSYAFQGAAGPRTLTMPSTVQSINEGAFRNCFHLRNVVFENGETVVLTMYGSSQFPIFGNSTLTTVIFPERMTELNWSVFDNNPLKILYIPQSVTSIAGIDASRFPDLTIYGVPDSTAEMYAKENEIPFKDRAELEAVLRVQSVRLSQDSIEETGEDVIGKQIQLYAEVLPDTALNIDVIYQSDNEEVVTVDEEGLVTITGYGKAKITVITEDGGKTAECEVTVLKEPVEDKPLINSVLFPKKMSEYSAVYTGEQIRPAMIVEYQYTDESGRAKTQKLKLNVDYTVSYSNNVNAGENTAKVTVRGIGEYMGVITREFTIKPKSISGVTLSPVGDIVFGEEPSVIVTDAAHELSEGKDYQIILSATGSENTDTPSVLTVEGIGNYTGVSKKSAKFNILRTGTDVRSIADETIRVEFKKMPSKGYIYNGKVQKPGVIVTDTVTGKKLSSSEYKVIYANNVNAGIQTAKVWVVGVSKDGKGYYGISEPLAFDIMQKDFGKVSASLSGTIPKGRNINNIKNAINEAVTVKDGKHILSKDEYTMDYGNIVQAEDIRIGVKYPVTLTPKAEGNYIEHSKKVIYIKFGQLNLASKTAKVSIRITNAPQNEIEFRYNGILLVKGRDYTAEVKQDKDQDTYTVKIKAVKDSAYKGSRTVKKLQVQNDF